MHAGIEINNDGRDVFQSTFDDAERFMAGVSLNELVAGFCRGLRDQCTGSGIGIYQKESRRFHVKQSSSSTNADCAPVVIRCA